MLAEWKLVAKTIFLYDSFVSRVLTNAESRDCDSCGFV